MVVAAVANALLSVPLAVAVAALVDPGYTSDPGTTSSFAGFFVVMLGFLAVGMTLLCLVWADGRRLLVAGSAVAGLALPAGLVQPWA
ncbi:hypothetical protein GCM10023340_06260 [Nocardioides marinquilinus]|uniref:MFS transporter n=1 Tax=Nocardioides marinquilinus TaxID=1210400 RepID=A0ABP9P944_9ACTN